MLEKVKSVIEKRDVQNVPLVLMEIVSNLRGKQDQFDSLFHIDNTTRTSVEKQIQDAINSNPSLRTLDNDIRELKDSRYMLEKFIECEHILSAIQVK